MNICLNSGSCQPSADYSFPTTNGHSFCNAWFICEMPDKTKHRRFWLTYSKSHDRAYCLVCMLFSGHQGSEIWTTTGYNNWVNGGRDIQRHERSTEHHNVEVSLIQWRRRRTIGQLIDKNRCALVKENWRVL